MAEMTIGEVARRSGLRPSALRWYEQIGLLAAPARCGGRRRYAASVLGELAAIRVACGAGFTLAEIRALRGGPYASPSTAWRALAPAKLAELRARIAAAQAMARLVRRGLRCRCRTLATCTLLRARPQLSAAPGRAARARPGSRR
ncbi:MAG: MerR family transcriptional regulator [bacterium]|nr:MerR family transcriptional regulator [bacterium]